MPTVPTLQQHGQILNDVADQSAPAARLNPTAGTHAPAKVIDTFGIEQGQRAQHALSNIGQDLLRQQVFEQNQINQTRVNDAVNQAVEARLKLTYDKDSGFLNLQGKDALNRPDGQSLDDEVGGKYQQQVDAIAQGLGNDAQRRDFMQVANQMAVQLRGGVQQHVAREYNQYQLSVQDGTMKTAQQQMGLAWGDVSAVEQAKNAIKSAVYETGRLRGWSGQQTEAAMVEQLSAGHSSVLSAAIDAGNLDYAREYMKQNTSELTPDARLHLTKVLDVGQFEAKTQGAAEKLYADAQGDPAAALAAARAQYSGKEEDAIVQRIKGFDQEKVALRERAQATAVDSAWQIYSRTGRLGSIPPSIIAAMDGRALHSLRAAARADAEAAAEKREVKTDPNIYYALSAMEGQQPEQFKQLDLRNFFDRLSPADRKRFIDSQTESAKPGRAAEVASFSAQKEAMIQTLQLKKESAGLFMQQADKAIFAAQQEKGRPLNQGERQKELDALVLKGSIDSRHWWAPDSTAYNFQARAQGKEDRFRAQYPEAEREKAKAALQRRGKQSPTNDEINAVLDAAYGFQR